MFLGSRVGPVREADNLTSIYEPIVYTSDGQLAARGLIYSGPHQISGLFLKNLNFTTVMT
jgi:hypothetical protein